MDVHKLSLIHNTIPIKSFACHLWLGSHAPIIVAIISSSIKQIGGKICCFLIYWNEIDECARRKMLNIGEHVCLEQQNSIILFVQANQQGETTLHFSKYITKVEDEVGQKFPLLHKDKCNSTWRFSYMHHIFIIQKIKNNHSEPRCISMTMNNVERVRGRESINLQSSNP